MADNIQLSTNVGTGEVLATDDVGGAHYQYVKVAYGTNGAASIVTGTNGLPVNLLDSSVAVTSATATNMNVTVGNSSFTVEQATATAFNATVTVSGNATIIQSTASNLNARVSLNGGDAIATPGSAAVAKCVQLAGSDGTNAQTVAVTSTGVVKVSDAGGSITIDGTVTADAGTGPWPVTDNGGSLTVDGTVTANLSATDNAVLDNIDTNTTGLNGCVSGTELQVDVVGALPAGGNAIGTVSVTSTDGIAAEAAALGNGILIQGDDGTDRKNINVDATTGDLQVDVTNTVTVSGTVTADAGTGPWPITDNGGSLTVDNSGTFAVQVDGDALTALQLIDDSIATDGSTITAKAVAVAGTDGTNAQIISTSSTGVVNVGDGGGSLTVDGTVTANLSATDNTVLDSIDTNTTGLAGCVSGTELQVDIVGALPAGTNAIGKLAANSGVDIGDVDILSQPARDRTTDNVGVALQTDVIMNDTTALTPKYAVIDDATSGDNTLVAAVAGKKIRVLSLFMVSAGTVTARLESGAAGTALTGQMNLVANSGFTLPFNPVGWFETASNTLLNLELSAAVSVDGCLVYVEV